MPTYEYACKACDLEFERDQRISDPPVATCPRCKKKQVKRLISRTSFHLKGGGWYSDLYSKPKDGGKSDGESKSESSPSSSSGGGESKPDSKPEKKAGKKKSAKSGASSGGSGSGGGSGSKAAA